MSVYPNDMALFLSVLAAVAFHGAQAPGKLVILDPAQPPFADSIAVFQPQIAGTVVDGFVVRVRGTKKGRDVPEFDDIAGDSDPWREGMFADSITALKAAKEVHLFLEVGMSSSRVDAFDDFAWREISNRLALAAKICREASLEGITLKLAGGEDRKFPLFTYFDQPHWSDHKLQDWKDKLRARGKETMTAMLQANPNLTLLLPDFLSALTPTYNALGRPAVRPGEAGDLLPIFVSGWMDAANGNPAIAAVATALPRGASSDDFLAVADRVVAYDRELLEGEDQSRYGATVLPTVPLDLADFEGNAGGLSRSLEGGLQVSGRYVCLQVSDATKVRDVLSQVTLTPEQRNAQVSLSDRLKTFSLRELASSIRTEPSRIVNGGIVGRLGWDTTVPYGDGQADYDPVKGNQRAGSLFVKGIKDGSWTQTVAVSPGESYGVQAYCLIAGVACASVEIDFNDEKGRPLPGDIAFVPSDGTGWQPILGRFNAPPRATQATVRLRMLSPGQRGDQVWFDDIRLVAL